MSFGRCLALCLCIGLASPALAQDQKAPPPAAGPDIVVQASPEGPSAWRRAESAHLVVTSKGSEAELRRITLNLERLYALMSRLYRRPAASDDTAKLHVTLIDTADFFKAMDLRNVRSAEGPYASTFAGQRYYDPREDGPVLAVARTDQIVKLSTALAEDRDLQDSNEAGGDGESAGGVSSLLTTANRPPIARAWEAVLYSAFAEHYLLTYVPAAYPRWYVDGVGALFSTLHVRRDGKLDYAEAPENYRQVFRAYGDVQVGDVLTGHYLTAAPARTRWTPYHAWLMAHFFLFSQLKPERARQFQQYMTAIQRGTPMAEAATVFGNLKRLQSEILGYADRTTEFARADAPADLGGDVLVNTLSRSSAAMIEERIELGAHFAQTAPADATMANTRDTAWLAQLRTKVSVLPYNADALLIEAEAECRSGHADDCRAAAERVLEKAPRDVRALAWQGTALTQLALAAQDRATALVAARKPLERAIQIDPDAPLPAIAYYRSFADAGEAVPDAVLLGLAKVTRSVPAAPAPRLLLARELMRRGEADTARRVVAPVLYGAYDSPEKSAAEQMFAPVATP